MASDSIPPDFPTSSPIVAGKFELLRLLGRGGMGSVWEGRHLTLGTRVAIKFVEKDFAASSEARARFETEAQAVARLQSRYAIKVYDHGITEDGKPFIVMEYLVGETLDQRLQRFGRLNLPDISRIISQVTKALQKAHDEGIIHRDLKPENIFLAKEDDEEVAKVLDFGIAKMKEPDGTSGAGISSSTKTGAVLGTPFYMSPEQARGLRGIDHRTDAWSLGVIVYRCVVGELPFNGQSVGDLLVNICTAPSPIPSQHMPGLSPAFDHWFTRTVTREPAARFNRVLELAESLASIANGGQGVAGYTQGMPQYPTQQNAAFGAGFQGGYQGAAYQPASTPGGSQTPMSPSSGQHGYGPPPSPYGAATPQGMQGGQPALTPNAYRNGPVNGSLTGSPSTLTPGRISGLPKPGGGRNFIIGVVALAAVGTGILLFAMSPKSTGISAASSSTIAPTPSQEPAVLPIANGTTDVQPLQALAGDTKGANEKKNEKEKGDPRGTKTALMPGKTTSTTQKTVVIPPPPPPPTGKTVTLPPPPPPPTVKPNAHPGDPGF